MTAPRPLILGHSHAGSLFDAADEARLDSEHLSFWLVRGAFHDEADRVVIGAPLLEAIERASMIVSAVGGGACRVLALLGVVRPFDFVAPDEASRPVVDDVEFVPFAAVREAVMSQERVALAILRAIAERTRVPVVHVLPPRPTRRWDGAEALALTRLTASLLGISATPEHDSPQTHARTLKLWQVMVDVHRDHCAALGVPVASPPGSAFDAEGFLLDAFARDPMHGNARYGRAVLAGLGLVAAEEAPLA